MYLFIGPCLHRAKWLLGIWLVLLQALPSAAAEPPLLRLQQVSPHSYYVEGLAAMGSPENRNFISNAGVVLTPAGVVLIDALGSPALAAELLLRLREITPLPVTHVVLTHYHADHIYGLQTLKAQGARIIAQRAAEQYLGSETARQRLEDSRTTLAPWVNADTRLVPPDQWVDGETELVVGGVHLLLKPVGPSHTPEDLAVYFAAEKVLFAGDLVFRKRVPFVGQADSRHWISALDDLLQLGAQAIVPGHGPMSTEARQDMQLTRDYLVHLRSTMGPAAKNMEPFDNAYQAADWSRFESLPLFRSVNRMNAYNTYLLMERESE